jgi:hypothetical protein
VKTRNGYLRKKEAEEAKNGAARAKVDQDFVKTISKKESVIGKKIAKEQARQKKATDRVTKNQIKRGAGK